MGMGMTVVKINTFLCFLGFSIMLTVSLFTGEPLHPAMPVYLVGYMVQAAILVAIRELKR